MHLHPFPDRLHERTDHMTTRKAPAKTATKKAPTKGRTRTPKNPIGAKATAAKLAAPVQIPATDDLQALCDERTEIVGRIVSLKGQLATATEELHRKNDEMLAGGARPGMIFTVDGDPMQFTHNVKPSKSYAAVLKELIELHPELAEEVAVLEIKHTKENQQQPNFKAP